MQLLVNVAWHYLSVSTFQNIPPSTSYPLVTAVLVGEAQAWLPDLIERTRKLKVNGGFESGADL